MLKQVLSEIPMAPDVSPIWFRAILHAARYQVGGPRRESDRAFVPVEVTMPDLPLWERRLDASAGTGGSGADLAERDRMFLRDRLTELREAYGRLEFVLPAGLVHGDANIGNIIRRQADGVAVLIDWDGVAAGPRGWWRGPRGVLVAGAAHKRPARRSVERRGGGSRREPVSGVCVFARRGGHAPPPPGGGGAPAPPYPAGEVPYAPVRRPSPVADRAR